MNISNILLENKDLLYAIIIPIISIFIAVDQSTFKKEYQKKYILSIYSLLFFYFSFKIDLFVLLSILFFTTLLSGINLAYNSCGLEKELNKLQLLIYKCLQWIFISKTYIIYVYFIIIYLFKDFFMKQQIFSLILVFIFILYHLLSNLIDKFGVFEFEKFKNKIKQNNDNFYERINDIKELDFIIEGISFIVYMEDKYYFKRKGVTILSNLFFNSNKNQKNNESEIKYKKIKKLINRFKKILNKFKKTKKIKRGYSTIPQQIIRNNVMHNDSYRYTIRRKIFVEWIYTYMFFKAYKNQKRLYHKKTSMNKVKVDLLKIYWSKILGFPNDQKQLLEKMSKQSSLTLDAYQLNFDEYKLLKNKHEKNIIKKYLWRDQNEI